MEESSLCRLAYSGALPSRDVRYSNSSHKHRAVVNKHQLNRDDRFSATVARRRRDE